VGRLWEASLALEEVLARSKGPTRQRAHLLLARALAKSPSGAKRAEIELKVLIEEDPACVEGYLGLGQLYREKGFVGRAEAMFRHVLALEPGNARALQELAALLPPVTPRGRLNPRGLLDLLRPPARR
jgi:cytochrome c-type biogenesis protein CcmH/NrfG